MPRQTIHWERQGISGPELRRVLPTIVPSALKEEVALTETVMTLILYIDADDPRDWSHIAEQIAASHPARVLILRPASTDGPSQLDARVLATIEDLPGSTTKHRVVFSECLDMTLHGPVATYWIDWIQPLIRSDLPSYLWWLKDPPAARFRWDLLASGIGYLVIDSDSTQLDKWAQALRNFSPASPMKIYDLAWVRTTAWRRVLAEAADHGPVLDLMATPDTVHFESPPEQQSRMQYLWFWLSHQLRWNLYRPELRWSWFPADTARGVFTKAGHELVVAREDNRIVARYGARHWSEADAPEPAEACFVQLMADGPDALFQSIWSYAYQHLLSEETRHD